MTNETESHGVDVWMCATIYVQADSEEAAEAIVAEQAGTRDRFKGLELAARDITLYDFADGAVMSPPVSLYGLAHHSKLVAVADPVRDAAPEMLGMLNLLIAHNDSLLECLSNDGADDVPELVEANDAAKALVMKAKGGVSTSNPVTAKSLEAKYGRWQDHPDYSDRDWRNDETRLGYWEWVASKVNDAEGGAV